MHSRRRESGQTPPSQVARLNHILRGTVRKLPADSQPLLGLYSSRMDLLIIAVVDDLAKLSSCASMALRVRIQRLRGNVGFVGPNDRRTLIVHPQASKEPAVTQRLENTTVIEQV